MLEPKTILIAAVVVLVLAVLYMVYGRHGKSGGCTVDTDCPASAVCDSGACRDIAPPARGAAEVYALDVGRYGVTTADQAAALAAAHGGAIATQEQLEAAHAAGAQWCAAGWTRVGHGGTGYVFAFPIQQGSAMCGPPGVNSYPAAGGAAVNVYGVKPAPGTLPDCSAGKPGACIWNFAMPVPGASAPAARYAQ